MKSACASIKIKSAGSKVRFCAVVFLISKSFKTRLANRLFPDELMVADGDYHSNHILAKEHVKDKYLHKRIRALHESLNRNLKVSEVLNDGVHIQYSISTSARIIL